MKFGLVGSPISMSLSPGIHTAIMEVNEVNGSYELIESTHIPPRVIILGYDGLNFTTPLKERIIEIMDSKDSSVQITGSANTLLIGEEIIGYNTDYYALLEILGRTDMKPSTALIIGAGGAARAAVAAVKESGAKIIHIQNRSYERASKMARDMGGQIDLMDRYDIIVNAVPPDAEGFLRKVTKNVTFKSYIDFNYSERSPLTDVAERKGIRGINGLDILILQAIKSQEIWNRRKMSYDFRWGGD